MLCDRCKKNNAVYYFKSTVNGKTSEYHLCPECAEEFGIVKAQPFVAGDEYQFGISPLFAGVAKPSAERRICPVCGASAEEITKTGYAGCSQCYKTFSDLFSFIVPKLHGRVTHNGRAPMGFNSEKYRRRTAEKEIASLKAQLDEAVKVENYELAAKLRDQINALKTGDN